MFSPIFFSRYVRIGILFIDYPPFIIQLPYYKYLRPFKQFLLCIFLNFIRHVYMGVAAKNEDPTKPLKKRFLRPRVLQYSSKAPARFSVLSAGYCCHPLTPGGITRLNLKLVGDGEKVTNF